jgi:histidine triad (HIT) family protein
MATVFSKIISKEIPAKIVYEDDLAMAFYDIHPQAPIHILIVPKKEIESLATCTDEDGPLLGHLQNVARKLAHQLGLENGYRLVTNIGVDGGQTVGHLHYHLLGARPLGWPPG